MFDIAFEVNTGDDDKSILDGIDLDLDEPETRWQWEKDGKNKKQSFERFSDYEEGLDTKITKKTENCKEDTVTVEPRSCVVTRLTTEQILSKGVCELEYDFYVEKKDTRERITDTLLISYFFTSF